MTAPRRLLFVHAHPDDETLATGVTMAHYARAGHEVHLLTCTLGEEGEVIPPDLQHLVADRDDALGPHRREELREAMRRLGVQFAVLGEDRAKGVPSRYRDSGMAGTPSAERADAFARADVGEAADLVASHLRRVRPDVVVTYDQGGGYGHPDHIQAHVVTFRALELVSERDRPASTYVIVTPRSWAHEDRTWLASHVPPGSGLTVRRPSDPYPVSVVPDEDVTHVVVDTAVSGVVAEAMAAHATQVAVFGDHFCLSSLVAARVPGREAFMQVEVVRGEAVPTGPTGRWHAGLLGLDEGMLT